jgi:GTP-binding nuclear protein Ran
MAFYTSYGPIELRVSDPFAFSITNGFYATAKAAIIFFDLTSRLSYRSINSSYSDIRKYCLNEIPVLLVGNKVDEVRLRPKYLTFHRKHKLDYIEMSALTNYNIEKPFEYIIRKLLGDPNTRVTCRHPPLPPLYLLSHEMKEKIELRALEIGRLNDETLELSEDDDF